MTLGMKTSSLKCCICGSRLSDDQVNSFYVDVHNQRLGTCGAEHQSVARKNPEQCLNVIDSGY